MSRRVCPKEAIPPPREKGPELCGASDYGSGVSTVHTAEQTEAGKSYRRTCPRRNFRESLTSNASSLPPAPGKREAAWHRTSPAATEASLRSLGRRRSQPALPTTLLAHLQAPHLEEGARPDADGAVVEQGSHHQLWVML